MTFFGKTAGVRKLGSNWETEMGRKQYSLAVSFFEFQQLLFHFQLAAEPAQIAVCGNHPVAGYNDRERVIVQRPADGTPRLRLADLFRDPTIVSGLYGWNVTSRFLDLFLQGSEV
jgi:hypothetical protein